MILPWNLMFGVLVDLLGCVLETKFISHVKL